MLKNPKKNELKLLKKKTIEAKCEIVINRSLRKEINISKTDKKLFLGQSWQEIGCYFVQADGSLTKMGYEIFGY